MAEASVEVARLTAAIGLHAPRLAPRPLVVALDGRSGAGKSTLAAAVGGALARCVVIEGDDFYGAPALDVWDSHSTGEQAASVIDWRRIRPVLDALRARRVASWHAYDWDRFDGRLVTEPTVVGPADVVILEGVYSARPELADLVDLRVLLDPGPAERVRRLREREGDPDGDPWPPRWARAEAHYFDHVVDPAGFDLVL